MENPVVRKKGKVLTSTRNAPQNYLFRLLKTHGCYVAPGNPWHFKLTLCKEHAHDKSSVHGGSYDLDDLANR